MISPADRSPAGHDELLAQAMVQASDAIFCRDVSGTVLTWNDAAERLYGLTSGEILGRPLDELVPPGSREQLATAHAAALAGGRPERFDSTHAHRDGSPLAVAVSVFPVRDHAGDVQAVCTTVSEVGARTRLAAELELTRAELQRNDDALRRSNRDLEQFAYVASHDLSEPLRVMTGYVTQLERRYDAELDERGRRYMHHIVEASSRMRALIDDLLDYSRFLRAPGATDDLDLGVLFERVAASLAEEVREHAGNIEIAALPRVHADAGQLERVLHNLLGNALKFRAPGRPPQVVVTAREADGWVTLHVDDNGIGIAPQYRERVFRMFQRLHVREAYPGTGIGLAIAQQVIEMAGGRIWIEDSPLGGARFCCLLPAASRRAA